MAKKIRKPVAGEIVNENHFAGIVSPGLKTGPVDSIKTRIARLSTGSTPNIRNAGMMLDYAGAQGTWGASSTDAFHTSYATGNIMYGQRDIPTYFVMMNQQNGGVLYWPASLREKFEWYRYFARTDAYVGRALELLSDLPMSKINLTMPKMKDTKLQKKIHLFYKDMCDRINIFQRLQEILWEWNMIGNCFPADTYINTIDGKKCITDIKINDLVLTHKQRYCCVKNNMSRKISECLVEIILDDGKKIKATKEHPFLLLLNDKEVFIYAKDIRIGDIVVTLENNDKKGSFVVAINEIYFDGYVYNLEVDEDHTFCANDIFVHNCFAFHEYDEDRKAWSKIVILPPEEVSCFTYPFSDNARIEFKPQRLIEIIKSATQVDKNQMDPKVAELIKNIPQDVIDMIDKEGSLVMDSDPMAGNSPGSFVYHFARRRSPYLDLGASVLERVLIPMLQKENYRYTQLALATRNMTPKNKISAPGLTQPELDNLREQLDLSYMDPDYTIVTNYEWNWDQIGSDGRLLNLQSEYESIENQVFAALGVTRELLTGEGTYAGNRITIEVLNTVFLLTREMLKNYVENSLFKPVAEAHGWYYQNDMGIKEYWHPKLSFNRLSIRDNQEVFENLLQLYQKGSVPIDIIFELLNLDSDNIAEVVKNDLFTVKDPTFNRVVEGINEDVGHVLSERSDIVEKVAEYLDLKLKEPVEEENNEFGEGFENEELNEKPNEEEPTESLEQVADEISKHIPKNTNKEEVKKIVQKLNQQEKQI